MGNSSSSTTNNSGSYDSIIADTTSPEYWRNLGDQLSRQRNQAFEDSKAAYAAGNHALAGRLSRQGKDCARQAEQAHERAAALFLQRNNPGVSLSPGGSGPPPGQIDLHGLRVKEAVATVERALSRGRAAGQARLVLVVGRGLHSAGGVAKLRPAIEQLVRRHNVRVTAGAPNAGCITVEFVSEAERGWVDWLAERTSCVIC
ncbi:hypothetical protein PLESTB_001159700 [Pleodorina starrii]|uniref:Smr domain-containing protein n=1 Tax=Pleodorina starrii TaxID=330485 RepID=A0A9W6BS33_9CHLO|nr:hypothetical protein PLESTM_000236300 [Pleodorina starrii]GLC56885.1 hypothetical protein PLESTB_001159700 [Pleodorina starrii]GLC64723.1 hypothetical protein PLESTF_000200500 [Pleodorina starrii]